MDIKTNYKKQPPKNILHKYTHGHFTVNVYKDGEAIMFCQIDNSLVSMDEEYQNTAAAAFHDHAKNKKIVFKKLIYIGF